MRFFSEMFPFNSIVPLKSIGSRTHWSSIWRLFTSQRGTREHLLFNDGASKLDENGLFSLVGSFTKHFISNVCLAFMQYSCCYFKALLIVSYPNCSNFKSRTIS